MRRWLVTFGGAGMLPAAPGTAGSLAASLVLLAIYLLIEPSWVLWPGILGLGLITTAGLCVVLGPWTVDFYGRKDPGPCVLDEAAGICLTMLALPMYGRWSPAIAIGAAFVAFRVFDIAKPWPCKKLEKFPAGWGILMDDLAAAVYANLVCQLVLRM